MGIRAKNVWPLILVVFVLAGCVQPPALQGEAEFAEGAAAYKLGNYTTAMRSWLPLAEQGVVQAQNNVGIMYRKGQGVPQDYVKARQWFELATEKGYDPAQLNMGLLYRQGLGVTQDFATAAEWYKKAALRGNVEGQYNLGLLYIAETGALRNRIQAYVWFRLAAVLYPPGRLRDDAIQLREAAYSAMTVTQRDVGEREAAFRLGWAYHVGQSTEANPGEALKFYCRSAELGLDAGAIMLEFLGNSTPGNRSLIAFVVGAGIDPLKWATTVVDEVNLGFRQIGGSDRPLYVASAAAESCRSLQ